LLTPVTERRHQQEWTEDDLVELSLDQRLGLERELELERKYPQSGLYRNDGSTKLLWPVEYISICKEIHISNGGIHLVVAFLDWEYDNVSDRGNALDFYASGKLLASYREESLISAYWVRFALSRWCGLDWVTVENAVYDDRAQTFQISTNQGDEFTFDVTTGDLISSSSPWPIGFALLFGFFALVVYGLWRTSRRTKRE